MRLWDTAKTVLIVSFGLFLMCVGVFGMSRTLKKAIVQDVERELLMAKNLDVVSSFLGHVASEGAISTDGKELRSFGIVIARWDGEDEIIMPDSSVYWSVTTTKHRNLVRTLALSRGIIVKEVN